MIPTLRSKIGLLALLPLLMARLLDAAPPAAETRPEPPSNPEGRELAERLRQGWPEEDMTVNAALHIREHRKPTRRVPLQFAVRRGADSWQAIYTVPSGPGIPAETLVITHTPGSTNRYTLHKKDDGDRPVDLFAPLGGSDFWIVDLGMDFLHWPGQRLLKTEMRKGRWCRVLESSRPPGVARGYQRVVSWLDKEQGQPILAEAYDARGELLKEFSIGSFTKVDGEWRLEDMKIVNVQERSRTELEFHHE